jgi:hypothetical protein
VVVAEGNEDAAVALVELLSTPAEATGVDSRGEAAKAVTDGDATASEVGGAGVGGDDARVRAVMAPSIAADVSEAMLAEAEVEVEEEAEVVGAAAAVAVVAEAEAVAGLSSSSFSFSSITSSVAVDGNADGTALDADQMHIHTQHAYPFLTN